MSRPSRTQIANGLYHVTTRGNRRQRIFEDKRDGEVFLLMLADVVVHHRWQCHSYCLMPNHYHLLVETPSPDISCGMHRLNSRFAHWFNARHNTTGHLFERRYRAVLVETDEYLLELVRYLALNPVRASLCDRAELWEWSSYGALVRTRGRGPLAMTKRIVEAFSTNPERALERLRAFVDEGRPKHSFAG